MEGGRWGGAHPCLMHRAEKSAAASEAECLRNTKPGLLATAQPAHPGAVALRPGQNETNPAQTHTPTHGLTNGPTRHG